MRYTVRSLVFPEVGKVALTTASQELDPGGDGVVLATRYSCISAGTELAKLSGLQTVPLPHVPGNRAIGRVLAAGPRRNLQPGDLVFAHSPHQSHATTTGLAARLPELLDRPDAALLGLAMVALTGVRVGAPELGDSAVVMGAGLVGNLAAQLLALSGARVILVDRDPARLALAQRVGIEQVVDSSSGEAAAAVAEMTGGEGADLLLECTGSAAVAAAAPACCRRGATMVLVGSPRAAHPTDLTAFLNHVHLYRPHGDLTLKGAHEWKIPLRDDGCHKHSMERNAGCLAELMAAGRLRTAELVSRVYAPAEAAEAYADLQQRPGEHLAAVFDWSR